MIDGGVGLDRALIVLTACWMQSIIERCDTAFVTLCTASSARGRKVSILQVCRADVAAIIDALEHTSLVTQSLLVCLLSRRVDNPAQGPREWGRLRISSIL